MKGITMAARKENGIYVVRETMEVNRYDFDGTADALMDTIDLVVEKARAKGMVGDGYFDFDVERDYDYCVLNITYNFDRTETDRERTARERAEAKLKEDAANKRKKAAEARKLKKDAEYAEFLRLKEKFGDI
jgi:hypothetical protein